MHGGADKAVMAYALAAFTPVLLPVGRDVNSDFGLTGHLNPAAKLYLLYRGKDKCEGKYRSPERIHHLVRFIVNDLSRHDFVTRRLNNKRAKNVFFCRAGMTKN